MARCMPGAKGENPGRAVRVAGQVAAREALGSMIWLTVRVPGWPGAKAGQFAMLHSDVSACFLPRAFSVASQTGEEVSFLIAPIGAGTNELGRMNPGDRVWVTGPLGRGFDETALLATATGAGPTPAPPAPRIVIVAGGVGAAPFPLLLDRLGAAISGEALDVLVLLGFRDEVQAEGAAPVTAAAARLVAAGATCRVEVATEDGSNGPPQLVTDLLAAEQRAGDRVAACGPRAMSAAVWQLCNKVPGTTAWFSLEAGMACGVGSCHGCAMTLADGSTARVCRDGPVFSGAAVFGAGPTFGGGATR